MAASGPKFHDYFQSFLVGVLFATEDRSFREPDIGQDPTAPGVSGLVRLAIRADHFHYVA